MMGQMSLDNLVEKSKKKNDQDQVDGMRQEVYSKGKEMHNDVQCWQVFASQWKKLAFSAVKTGLAKIVFADKNSFCQ